MKVVVENQQEVSGWFKAPHNDPPSAEVDIRVWTKLTSRTDRIVKTAHMTDQVSTAFVNGVTSWTMFWTPVETGDYKIIAKAYSKVTNQVIATKTINVQVRVE